MTPTIRGQDTTALLHRIVHRIIEAVDPEQVILFGSRAKGTATDSSDIDLCVIADMDGSRRERKRRLQELLGRRSFSMDVLTYTPEEFNRQKQLLNSVTYFINKHGETLYFKEGDSDASMEEKPESKPEDWIQKWFEKADRDLRTARMTLEADDPMPDVACYHTQQCAEKYLKGFLTARRQEVEKTHSLTDLLDRCTAVDASFEQFRDACKRLNDYAVEVRYPEAPAEPDEDEARAAVKDAERIRAFVLNRLYLK